MDDVEKRELIKVIELSYTISEFGNLLYDLINEIREIT